MERDVHLYARCVLLTRKGVTGVQVKQVNGSVVYVVWNETRFADEADGGYPGREEVVPS